MEVSLKKRVLTALIGLPFIFLILFSPTPIVVVGVMIASGICMYEYYNAVGLKDKRMVCALGYLAALIIPLGIYLPADLIMPLIYLYVVALFVVMLIDNKRVTMKDLAMLIMGLVYIPYFLSSIAYIRDMELGRFYIWLVFIGAFITDTFAYFTGCSIGGPKLCPSISPKKTIAGAIGGVVGCGLSFIIFGLIVNWGFADMISGKQMSLVLLFILGIIVAILSEIGDLVASMIKRQYNIKDFGNLLPGHGGILDRCDSIILVAPIIFLFLLKIGILA